MCFKNGLGTRPMIFSRADKRPFPQPDAASPDRDWCVTCEKSFHPLGIAAHRAAHRRRGQDCIIVYEGVRPVYHDFSRWRPADQVEP